MSTFTLNLWRKVLLIPHNLQGLLNSSISTCTKLQAGHSKWANIKHIKAAKDGQRAVLFARIVRQMRLAIQDGGSSNPQLNAYLRNVIDDAIKKNMPMTTIQATLKRYQESKADLKKYFLEIKMINTPIYLVCVAYTDNLSGLRMLMAPVVKKAGGSFTDARHLFDNRGVIEAVVDDEVKRKAIAGGDFEEICTTDAIECGAEEVEAVDSASGTATFLCDPVELDRISRGLSERGYRIESAEHVFIPKTPVTVSETERKACDVFREKLKNLDGVDEVYDNINFNEVES